MNQPNQQPSMRERMLSGDLYLARDPELLEMNRRAQRLLHTFNQSKPDDIDQRQLLIQQLFGSIGAGFEVKPPFYCDYGSNISAGEDLFINYDCVILDCNIVRLGNRVLLGPKVQIYTATHPLASSERRGGWESALPIEIGNDVWLGGGAIICPGVSIGDGSTIGAGSVVTRDVPPGVVAAGNPCRVLRAIEQPSPKQLGSCA